MNLAGRTALITGAGRGLGRAIALVLSQAGARVALVARTTSQLVETAQAVQDQGGEALTLALDVTGSEAPTTAIQVTLERWGRLDILVYNAGIAVTRPALEVTRADWDKVLAVNLTAAFFWSQEAARNMASAGGGRIVYIASVLGQTGAAQVAPYCASKGGLIALTRALAIEWARHGITVNAVAPGYVETALNASELADEGVRRHLLGRTPMRRFGTPEEVAGAVLYLVSDAAAYVTGHVLAVDGGWLAG